jgi:hypothetical protein
VGSALPVAWLDAAGSDELTSAVGAVVLPAEPGIPAGSAQPSHVNAAAIQAAAGRGVAMLVKTS